MKNPRRKPIILWPLYATAAASWIIVITVFVVNTSQALMG